MNKISYIVHLKNNKWRVLSEDGKNLGTFDSKKRAQKRLQQVEYFKHQDNEKKKSWQLIEFILKRAKKDDEDKKTYSSYMRYLNKNEPEHLEEFMLKFKQAFDQAIQDGLEDAAVVALMQARI